MSVFIRKELNVKNVPLQVFTQENFRKALIKWIVMCDQPFTEPQQETFVALVKTLNNDAQLVSAKTIKADIMATYNEKFEDVKKLVSEIPGKLSTSLDGWTSGNVLPFFAIRGHWLDENWVYKSVLLDFAYVQGKHSGWKHSCIFKDCMSRLEIPTTKLLAVTGDNASNNGTFFDWMEDCGLSELSNQIRCLCHIINLSVQAFLVELKIPLAEDESVDEEDYYLDNEASIECDFSQ